MNNDRFKFRVWDKKEKCFVSEMFFIECNGEISAGADLYWSSRNPDGFVIQQCTGLKDDNGKLIFEGDLLKHPNQKELGQVFWDEVATSFRVKYDESEATFALFLQINDRGQAVVIGNIFENKELLTG